MNADMCPRAVIFDLDGTLAPHLESPAPEMTARLRKLLDLVPVAILSSASFERIQKRVLPVLPPETNIRNLYILPSTGTQCYVQHDGAWRCEYELAFTDDEKARIRAVVADVILNARIVEPSEVRGEQFIDSSSQITIALLGIGAAREARAAWDPDRTKRQRLKTALEKMLPEFDIAFGGQSSIDIVQRGMDKAYGVRWLSDRLGVEPSEIVFVGDAFYPGGNDHAVIKTGVQTIEVSDPSETENVIDKLCAVCT